jgi:hypothetical protein
MHRKPVDYYLDKLKSYDFELPFLPDDIIGDLEVKQISNLKKLYINNLQWMNLSLRNYWQVFQFLSHIENSKGRVTTTGMGFLLRESWLVKKGMDVTVIESNENVIRYHMKYNPDICNKLKIVNDDAKQYVGNCDTLLLDHYEFESDDHVLNEVQNFKNRIDYETIWFWPIEKIIKNKSLSDSVSLRESYGELQRIIKGLPDLSDSSLKLYDNIWMGNI